MLSRWYVNFSFYNGPHFQRWKEGWDQCELRDNLDRIAERKCLKKEGLWRQVPFSAEIFDDKRDKLMANDNGKITSFVLADI